jgi:nickel transport protein
MILTALMLVLLCPPRAALAHKVNVFAWVEGDTVHTESKFSGGRQARQATIEVYDDQDNRLLTGRTDDTGKFSFKIPKATALRIVLIAGMGHQNEWRLDEAEVRRGLELGGDATPSAPADAPPPAPLTAVAESTPAAAKTPPSGISAEAVQQIVEKTLDRKLQPIVSMLVESRQSGPALQDILGGIGYIIGLVGLGAYLKSRRR